MWYLLSKSRQVLITLALCSLVFLGGCDRSTGEFPSDSKVIFLVIDSLRYDHLDAYGYEQETAPYLGQLIRDGADFTRAFAPSNYTVMSMPGIFLGKPVSHLYDPHPGSFHIPDLELTLAESFQQAGYETYLWSSNLHLRMNGYDAGFENTFCDYLQTRGIVSIEGIIREIGKMYNPTGKPELHYIHTMDVHFPYRPPHPYERMFRAGHVIYEGTVSTSGSPKDDLGNDIQSNFSYFAETHEISGYDIRYLVELYDGAIRYSDDHIPELLQTLEYDPERDLLIVTADHGEQFFSHGYWAHNRLLLPQETHVPLIIKGPGIPAKTITDPVSLMDLYPTLSSMYGLDAPPDMMGVDLSDALYGNRSINHTVYMENVDSMGPSAAIVHPDDYLYNFVSNRFPLAPWVNWPFAVGLYDLQEDLVCAHDLSHAEPERALAMHAELQRVNSRWSSFQSDLIGQADRNIEFGPDRMAAGTVEHVEDGPQAVDERMIPVDGQRLDAVYPSYTARASIDEPGARYTLTFDYEVTTPQAEFALRAEGAKEPFWSYPVTRASDELRHFQSSLKIEHPNVFVTLRVKNGGAMRFRNVQLRRMHVPDILPEPDPRVYNYDVAAPEIEMTQEEQDALEAIGYVQ